MRYRPSDWPTNLSMCYLPWYVLWLPPAFMVQPVVRGLSLGLKVIHHIMWPLKA